MRRSDFQLSSLSVSQLKLIFAYYRLQNNDLFSDVTADLTGARSEKSSEGEQLLKPEFLLSLKNRLECVFDKWQTGTVKTAILVTLLSKQFAIRGPYFHCQMLHININILTLNEHLSKTVLFTFYAPNFEPEDHWSCKRSPDILT